ncbi:MAG: FAD-dependent oxidoreductase [Ktedonobacteraceae bacterium]|nr:FAD-dependent oxidoreductase [Ktedonobacteraceae bacterium]
MQTIQDLVIIGGGVMGLSTAYAASHFTRKVTILEQATIGMTNHKAASFSTTRSIRNDYLDPFYARLAYQARQLWLELQQHAAEPFLIDCGCLNIATSRVTPDLSATYAVQSFQTLSRLKLKREALSHDEMQQRFPQFDVDLGRLDVEAGMLYVPEITRTLLALLRERQITIREGVNITHLQQRDGHVVITTTSGEVVAEKVVVVAGLGTNELLTHIEGCHVQFPLIPDRPRQCLYFIPPAARRAEWTTETLPVFAYLDVGIYGHPIYKDKTPGVKIGLYHPPDAKMASMSLQDIQSFVAACLPTLRDVPAVAVQDVDQCCYDLVADDQFILGQVPGFEQILVGVGWRGTGYKYAPWVGQTLMHLAFEGGTIYDIARFSPRRFVA